MEFLVAEWIGKPAWMWAGFLGLVLALLAFDLGVLHKEDREMGIRESLCLSAFYIGFAILFGGAVWWAYEAGHIVTADGTHAGIAFFTGFLIMGIEPIRSRRYDRRHAPRHHRLRSR
jgi:tellurite resistance protein TerC